MNTSHSSVNSQTIAVVIGLCGHGLAISRALTKHHIPVIALESNPYLPGYATKSATVRKIKNLNSDELIHSLRELYLELKPTNKPVLFLSSDRMVKLISDHWHQLSDMYKLSWSEVREDICKLLDKAEITKRCEISGLSYPKSSKINDIHDLDNLEHEIGFPLIVKPVAPLSKFKVYIAHSRDKLAKHLEEFAAELPFLAQKWIPGDDRTIYFAALYLRHGEVLARFEGRKIFSRPMGHTCIAIPFANDEIHKLALQFFANLNLSGPVSLELKRDTTGTYYVIEPTVGRTDFWIGLTIANDINIPYVEYLDQTGQTIPHMQQKNHYVWINGERDPWGLIKLAKLHPRSLYSHRPVFLYFSTDDMAPYIKGIFQLITALPKKALSRINKFFAPKK